MNYEQKDAELFWHVEQLKNGNAQSYNSVYELSQKYIYKIINDIVKDHHTTEDLMQETYLQIYNKIGSLQEAKAFYVWAGRIATNLTLRHIQKYRKEVLVTEDEEGGTDFVFDTAAADNECFIPENILMDQEKQRLLGEILDNLSVDQKLSVQYFYYEEMSVRDIAQAMECSEGTVKSRLNYARKAIKDAVLNLEVKQGTRLYSLSAMPLFLILFRQGAEQAAVAGAVGTATTGAAAMGAGQSVGNMVNAAPGQMVGNMVNGMPPYGVENLGVAPGVTSSGAGSAGAGGAGVSGSASAAGAGATGAGATGAGVTAAGAVGATGATTAATVAGMATWVKALIGVIAAAVIGVGGYGIYKATQDKNPPTEQAESRTMCVYYSVYYTTDGRVLYPQYDDEISYQESYQAIPDPFAMAETPDVMTDNWVTGSVTECIHADSTILSEDSMQKLVDYGLQIKEGGVGSHSVNQEFIIEYNGKDYRYNVYGVHVSFDTYSKEVMEEEHGVANAASAYSISLTGSITPVDGVEDIWPEGDNEAQAEPEVSVAESYLNVQYGIYYTADGRVFYDQYGDGLPGFGENPDVKTTNFLPEDSDAGIEADSSILSEDSMQELISYGLQMKDSEGVQFSYDMDLIENTVDEEFIIEYSGKDYRYNIESVRIHPTHYSQEEMESMHGIASPADRYYISLAGPLTPLDGVDDIWAGSESDAQGGGDTSTSGSSDTSTSDNTEDLGELDPNMAWTHPGAAGIADPDQDANIEYPDISIPVVTPVRMMELTQDTLYIDLCLSNMTVDVFYSLMDQVPCTVTLLDGSVYDMTLAEFIFKDWNGYADLAALDYDDEYARELSTGYVTTDSLLP